jgi:3-oxoacyl-ACP reductase-like protein
MGIFSSILSKLGFGDKKEEAAAPAPAPQPAATAAVPVAAADTAPVATPVPLPTPAISEVDVVAQLTAMAAASREKLNWKVSIVDLLKLLGLDSSLAARKELATELGCPTEKMADSAQMNMWLHKTVLRKLADNGGNIPADLLD